MLSFAFRLLSPVKTLSFEKTRLCIEWEELTLSQATTACFCILWHWLRTQLGNLGKKSLLFATKFQLAQVYFKVMPIKEAHCFSRKLYDSNSS